MLEIQELRLVLIASRADRSPFPGLRESCPAHVIIWPWAVDAAVYFYVSGSMRPVAAFSNTRVSPTVRWRHARLVPDKSRTYAMGPRKEWTNRIFKRITRTLWSRASYFPSVRTLRFATSINIADRATEVRKTAINKSGRDWSTEQCVKNIWLFANWGSSQLLVSVPTPRLLADKNLMGLSNTGCVIKNWPQSDTRYRRTSFWYFSWKQVLDKK